MLLIALLVFISAISPNVHAAATLTIVPASVVTNPATAASYIVTLGGGTANATYSLVLTGLAPGAAYSFSSLTIGSSGSSVLNIQTSVATPLYCPGSYLFTVTARNTMVSADYASATGSLSVNQVGPALVASVSTDKSTYTIGETVVISLGINKPAEGTLTISPPSGAPSSFQYQYPIQPTKTLILIPPVGTWTVTFAADDYCGVFTNAVAHFDVSSTGSSTNTTTVTSIAIYSYTSTISTTTTTEITSTTLPIFVVTETGNATVLNTLTSTSTTEQTISFSATLAQASTTSTNVITNIENPSLELGLGSILTILVLVIGINLVRRSRPGKAIICSNCGFKNPFTATSFCVRCGESLKRGRSP
jgi:hypothetical protein